MACVNPTRTFLGDQSQWLTLQLELDDVQGLWGGRRIAITGTRQVVVQLVQPEMLERRYEFELPIAAWTHLIEVFIAQDFVTIQPVERPGIPDEARPLITLTNAAKEQRSVAKWARIKDERFDAVYQALLQIEKLVAPLAPMFQGPYKAVG